MKRHKIFALYLLSFASLSVASDQKMTLDSDIFSPSQQHFSSAQQQKALDNLSKPIYTIQEEEEQQRQQPKSIPDHKVIPKDKIQGTLEGVTTEQNVKQKFGKAKAVDKVTQGDIQESALGSTTQTFGKATAENVSQGNIKGTTINGDLEQTFADDE